MRRETVRAIVSNLILFVIGVVMVLGFFYHGEFYQIGLVPLLVIGGGVVFVVLKGISWANSELGLRKKGRTGNLMFRAERVPQVLYGEVTSTVRPLKKSRLRVGMVCSVRASVSGRSAGYVLITDIDRKRLSELDDRDTGPEGRDVPGFKVWFKEKYGGDDDQIVRIIEFRSL